MSAGCPAGMESDDSEDDVWNDPDDDYHVKRSSNISKESTPKNETRTTKINSYQNHSIKPTSLVQNSKQPVRMLSAKVNTTDMTDDMRVAAIRNQVTAAKQYLQQGFKVDTVLRSGWTALMYACSCGNPDVAKLLLEYKANPNFHSAEDMFTPLMSACSSTQKREDERLECVVALTNFGADIDAYNRHHMTALMFATREGRVKIVEHLLSCKATVDMKDNRGWTALFWAASRGYGQIVRILLQNKCDATIVCFSGQTANDLANSSGYPVIGKVLENFLCNNLTPENFEEITNKMPNKEQRQTPNFSNSFVKYEELEMFLMSLNLQDLIPLFHDQHVTFTALLKMDEDDLEKMGVTKLGMRQSILKAIAGIHKKEWQKSSIPSIKNKTLITSEDIAHIILISGHHLSFLDSSVQYIQKQLKKNPQILQLAKEKADVRSMENLTRTSLTNCEKLVKQLHSLKSQLIQIRDNVEHLPVELITRNKSKTTESRSSLFLFGFIVVAAGAIGLLINKEKVNIVIKQHPWL